MTETPCGYAGCRNASRWVLVQPGAEQPSHLCVQHWNELRIANSDEAARYVSSRYADPPDSSESPTTQN
jgi:hypothetical protein